MWEIDELLKGSISLVQKSSLVDTEKGNVVWSLENLPEKHEMDAGGFSKTENNINSLYDEINPFKLGEILSKIAIEQNQTDYIYDWSAFLLNFSGEYFNKYYSQDNLKESVLIKIKERYHKYDFNNYEPKHATLAIYKNGNKYFSDEQNQLIKWFLD